MPKAERSTPRDPAVPMMADLGPDAHSVQFGLESPDRTPLQVEREYLPDQLGLGCVDQEPPVSEIVAQGHRTAHPDPFGLGLGRLVPNMLADDLSL